MIAVYKENIWCFLYISILVCANLKCFDLSKGVNFTPATLLGLELAPSSTDAGKSLQIKMSHLKGIVHNFFIFGQISYFE